MKQAIFAPGFRLSVMDGFALLCGVATAIVLSTIEWWMGFVLAFVLGHFFLFCNVVRLARPLELVWAGIFVIMAVATVAFGSPGWWVTALVSLFVTGVVVGIEMRKPSYHGVGWERINPGLTAWWEAHLAQKNATNQS
jgi:hypothetical protein